MQEIYFDLDSHQAISRHLFEEPFDGRKTKNGEGPSYYDQDDYETYVRAFGQCPNLDINHDIKAYLKARFQPWPVAADKQGNLWVEQ
jgi:hypothetical protein